LYITPPKNEVFFCSHQLSNLINALQVEDISDKTSCKHMKYLSYSNFLSTL